MNQTKISYDTIKAFRKKVIGISDKFLTGKNTIDKLIRDKAEEYIILKELPIPIQIGQRTILVGNFTMDTENTFFHQWAKILYLMCAKIVNMELADERREVLLKNARFDLLANTKNMMEFVMMDKWLYKKLIKLISKTLLKQQAYYLPENEDERKIKKWKNCTAKYFRKNVSKEDLIQICYLIYFYNFDSQKKSLKMILKKLNLMSLSETYIPFWLQNMAGVHGKFLLAQVPSIDSVFKSKGKTKVPINKTKKSNRSK